jgi:hypothetical protein
LSLVNKENMKFEQPPQNSTEAQEGLKNSDVLETSLKKVPEILAYIAAIAGSGGIAQAQELQANQIESGVQIEKNLEIDSLSRERFGVSIYDQCEKSGCQVIVEKPSANGKYIIHVAQVHTRGPREDSQFGYAMPVAQSQTIIYNLINNLQNPTIVDEGETTGDTSIYRPETSQQSFSDRYNKVTRDIEWADPESLYSGARETLNYQIYKRGGQIRDYETQKGGGELLRVYDMITEEYDSKPVDNRILTKAKKISSDLEYRSIMMETVGEDAVQSISSFALNYKTSFKYTSPLEDIRHRTLVALGAAKMVLMDGKQMTYLAGDNTEMLRQGNILIAQGKIISPEFRDVSRARNKVALHSAVESKDNMPIII